jgi:hypothetical protein
MTVSEFIFICDEYNIDPFVASKNKGVIDILKTPTSSVKQQIMLSGYLHKTFRHEQ